MNEEIYEVTRADYGNVVETIKMEYRDIKEYDKNDYHYVDIYSKLNGNRLTTRKFYTGEDKQEEKYYVWDLPDAEESNPAIPKYRLVLDTKEQVQAFFDALSKQQKEKT